MIRRKRRDDLIPFDMFSLDHSAREARALHKMERIYHRGQERAWDGKELLAEALERHGPVSYPAEKIPAIRRILHMLLWGELAAWRVSAQLADGLKTLEARMAATSQAHDEARHFYVLHDYISQLGPVGAELYPGSRFVMEEVIRTPSMAKKLLGMHLMIEPVALTLFQVIREQQLEPVLAELMPYYERDEARHVALGVQQLPSLIQQMGRRELLDFYAWQCRMVAGELYGIGFMVRDLEALGIDTRNMVELGKSKQMLAADLLEKELGWELPVAKLMERTIDMYVTTVFPRGDGTTPPAQRAAEILSAARRGIGRVDTTLHGPEMGRREKGAA